MTASHSIELQHTLREAVSVSGLGIFSAEAATVNICPAPPGSGIVFYRTDLENSPPILANLSSVQEYPRCTRLSSGGASVMMVEHLLSALYACGVDNARIEVQGPEIPGGDGSSLPFVERIESAGLENQEVMREVISVEKPLFWSQKDVHIVALPSEDYRLSYTLHYPQSPLIKSQYYSCYVDPNHYKAEIAPCRTFSLYEEVLPFIQKGLIKGGGLDNALVIQGDRVMNPGGARFFDEMVRHKILDLIGDLSLLGKRLRAHIIAICSGHSSNIAFAKVLSRALQPGSA